MAVKPGYHWPIPQENAEFCDEMPQNNTGCVVKEKKRNTEIRALESIERVELMIRCRRLGWLGHMARMETTQIPCQLMI